MLNCGVPHAFWYRGSATPTDVHSALAADFCDSSDTAADVSGLVRVKDRPSESLYLQMGFFAVPKSSYNGGSCLLREDLKSGEPPQKNNLDSG